MNLNFEPVMAALLSHLQAACVLPFTADAAADSAVLTNVSVFAGLFAGLPVFGPGAPRGATIAALDANARTVTLSAAVSATAAGGAFTAGFQTTGRRVKHWTQVAAQPALFLRRIGSTDEADDPFVITTLDAEAWIYCDAGKDPDTAPDIGLTALEQLVRASFTPDADPGSPRFTLGGLVYWCRFEGRADVSPGDQGDQALARLPIRITLP